MRECPKGDSVLPLSYLGVYIIKMAGQNAKIYVFVTVSNISFIMKMLKLESNFDVLSMIFHLKFHTNMILIIMHVWEP